LRKIHYHAKIIIQLNTGEMLEYGEALKMKFVDDLSIAARINLNADLIDDMGRQRPLTFDERFQTKLSDDANVLQEIVDRLKDFAGERQMLVNNDKSSVMMFTTSRTKAFPAEIFLNGKYLEVKQKMRILGVIVSSDLRWEENTDHICKKAYKNMWVLHRMKSLKMDTAPGVNSTESTYVIQTGSTKVQFLI
jgi:hypothetical protein